MKIYDGKQKVLGNIILNCIIKYSIKSSTIIRYLFFLHINNKFFYCFILLLFILLIILSMYCALICSSNFFYQQLFCINVMLTILNLVNCINGSVHQNYPYVYVILPTYLMQFLKDVAKLSSTKRI